MTLQEQVANKISESGATVKEHVINILAENEITKRTNLIIQALPLVDKLEKEFAKNNKPDVAEEVDFEGKVVKAASFTKNKYEQIKKAKEQLESLKQSIDNCLETNSKEAYSKLENLLKNAGGNKQENTSKDS